MRRVLRVTFRAALKTPFPTLRTYRPTLPTVCLTPLASLRKPPFLVPLLAILMYKDILYFFTTYLYSKVLSILRNLQGATVHVGLDGRHVEDSHGHLGVRGLRPELVVGIPQALSHRIDTDQGTSGEEVLALQ